jgi:amidohydrolase
VDNTAVEVVLKALQVESNITKSIKRIVNRFKPDLNEFEDLYKDLHKHAELSRREVRTSSVVAGYLRKLDFNVHERVGGYGVIGILDNGPGKAVLLRAELDALPIKEETGVPYASTQHMEDWWGRVQPVMHACGHDMHMASLMAAAKLLLDAKSEWSGTLIIIFQPNEEHLGGARAMIEDGLYNYIPVPDIALAQHLLFTRSGQLSIKKGPVLASADTIKIKVFSTEGYSANPQLNIDPVLLASNIVLKAQALVKHISTSTSQYAYIEAREIHAGLPGSDWVQYVEMVLDLKTYNQTNRKSILTSIREIVKSEYLSSGASTQPEVVILERAPLTSNDGEATNTVKAAFEKFFGSEYVSDEVPEHPVEDFSLLVSDQKVPYVFWWLGRTDPSVIDKAKREGKVFDRIPIEHSPFNAPVIHPTLEIGMKALSIAALTYLVAGEPE